MREQTLLFSFDYGDFTFLGSYALAVLHKMSQVIVVYVFSKLSVQTARVVFTLVFLVIYHP